MRLWRLLAGNASQALLALFLASVVWVVATYETDPPRNDFIAATVPVRVVNLRDGLVLREPTTVEVRIRARALSRTWQMLRANSFECTVDLKDKGEGSYELPVRVKPLMSGVDVIQVDPATIGVDLEEMAERRVRLRVQVLDEESVPLGYISRLPTTSTDHVTVSGPKNLVEQVAEAVLPVSVRNARDTVVKQEVPQLLDAAGRPVNGVTMTPGVVMVQVAIERQLGYRDVTVRASTTGTPAAGYWISNIAVRPALVTVYGSQSAIDELPGYLDTAIIDVEGANQDVVRRVPLVLPEGILVLGEGSGAEGIEVRVTVQPLLGGQTVQRDVQLQGLRMGLRAEASPKSVDVILSGPLPALQQLKPEDVRVTVELGGLSRGSHKVTPRVILPEEMGLEVKSIVPDTVEVSIESTTTSVPARP